MMSWLTQFPHLSAQSRPSKRQPSKVSGTRLRQLGDSVRSGSRPGAGAVAVAKGSLGRPHTSCVLYAQRAGQSKRMRRNGAIAGNVLQRRSAGAGWVGMRRALGTGSQQLIPSRSSFGPLCWVLWEGAALMAHCTCTGQASGCAHTGEHL